VDSSSSSSSSSIFSSHNLSRRRLDVCHTCARGVALVRILDPGLKRAACGSLKIQDAKIVKNLPSGHHRTTLSGYIFATIRHVWTIGKNFLSRSISSTCAHNMVNFGPLAAEIGPVVWRTPANFNGFRVLAALLQRRRSTEASQTLHGVWPSHGLLHYMHFLAPLRNFARCKVHFASKSCAFVFWQRYCTALQQGASAKLCGVEHRAPPIFGRATITLGIGPHSTP